LLLCAEPQHAFDPGPVVPAAVKDHDLPGRRQMRDVALDIHLRFLALGRRGQRDDPKDARAHPFCDGLDRAALARPVSAFEDNADLLAFVDDPLLQLHQLDVQAG